MECRRTVCALSSAAAGGTAKGVGDGCELLVCRALGVLPRQSLSALADYGLSDAEIARYVGLPRATLRRLRARWGIRRGA